MHTKKVVFLKIARIKTFQEIIHTFFAVFMEYAVSKEMKCSGDSDILYEIVRKTVLQDPGHDFPIFV